MPEPLLIAKSSDDSLTDSVLLPRLANRHDLIAGATGPGQTVSLQVLAEQFSRIDVPVFMADVKGGLSGISRPAKPNIRVDERRQLIATSLVASQYENLIDRESAFEKLRGRRDDANSATPSQQSGSVGSIFGKIGDILGGPGSGRGRGRGRESIAESAMKSTARDGLGSRAAHHPRCTGIDSGWTKVATTYLQ